MEKIHVTVFINAPRSKVWDTMLNDATYREWTKPFNPGGSYFKGNWEEGSEIRFLGPDLKSGIEGGMISRIKENRLHEFVSIEHIGIINNGVDDTTSDEVKKWTPAFENYTFTDKDGGTELAIDVDTNEEYKDMFMEMWPKALEALKELAEKQ